MENVPDRELLRPIFNAVMTLPPLEMGGFFPERYETPAEFVAVKVTGFQGEPTAEGMRYLPSRHYASIEFWKERNCLRVIDGQGVRAEIAQGLEKASTICPPEQWPSWATMSLDGSLNGRWPWE